MSTSKSPPSNRGDMTETESDQEGQLRRALEHEKDFAQRQRLLKRLWRLHQPVKWAEAEPPLTAAVR